MALAEHEVLLELPAPHSTTIQLEPLEPEAEAHEHHCNHIISGRSREGRRPCKHKASSTDPAWLPLCKTHLSKEPCRAGRCKAVDREKGVCGKLFRWNPPYFELCNAHREQPDAPCHIMKLPAEIRLEIFRYLLPDGPFDSSSQARPYRNTDPRPASDFLSILPVNRQFYAEAKDLLYGTYPFTIDIRSQGVFMCGRWIVQPKDEGGNAAAKIANSNSNKQAGISETADLFMKTFPFSYVKRYRIDIVFEDQGRAWNNWDKEVEVYDLRDYVRFVVLNFPRKSRALISLETHVVLKQANCSNLESANVVRLLTEPLMDLRGVVNAKLGHVYEGEHYSAAMTFVERKRALSQTNKGLWGPKSLTLCVLQPVPAWNDRILIECSDPDLSVYKGILESSMCSRSPVPIESELRQSFSRFKSLHTKFVKESDWVRLEGRESLLHRARVARENNDKAAFAEVLDMSIVMFMDFKEGQKEFFENTKVRNRNNEFLNDRRAEAHDNLASDLLRFLDSFQKSSPIYGPIFSSVRAPVIEIFDNKGKMSVEKLHVCQNPNFVNLPPTPNEMMEKDYAEIDELEAMAMQLQRQIKEKKRAVQRKWDTLLPSPTTYAPYLISPSTPNENDPFGGYDQLQPFHHDGTSTVLPTPPSSSQSSMHGVTMHPAWGSLPAGSSSSAHAGSSAGPSKSVRAAPSTVIVIPDEVDEAVRVTPSISYAGKGKGRADVIVLDEDDS